jgi:N-acetylglucosaminyldiphosphoundecaprenol N-acetyl-beta-D-mannosaminyltransferase
MSSVSLFGVSVQNFSRDAYTQALRDAVLGNAVCTIHTVNPEMLVDARVHIEFAQILSLATYRVPDGVGIRYATMALFSEIFEVHPGVDTIVDLVDLAHELRLRVAVCGAQAREHEAFKALLAKRAPAAELLCIDPGIIDERDPHLPLPVVERLVAFTPHILLVALGQGRGIRQGKQERIIQELVSRLSTARIIIGVGGALDMLSGRIERAPEWMRSRNLEWVYRFVLQPWRWKRMAKAFLVFPLYVVWETIKKGVFFSATLRVFRQVYKDLR